jgi:YgiT-type zinc finger domain-containing protein
MPEAPVTPNNQQSDRAMEIDEQVPRTCSQCGGTHLSSQTVRSAFWDKDRLVVIEDIPAIVCIDCNERHYDDTTVVLLDLLRGDGFPPEKALREITVPVFSLREKMNKEGSS